MIELDIATFITSFVTSTSTTGLALLTNKKNNIKIVNSSQKLKVALSLSIKTYNSQSDKVRSIFRPEYDDSFLHEIVEVNDLEMKSYVNQLVDYSEKCIDEYIGIVDNELEEKDIENLLLLSNYLKNFFVIISMIKEKAKDKDSQIKVSDYRKNLMSDVPNNLRKECGDVDADFSTFLRLLEDKVNNLWKEINDKLKS